MSDLRVIIADPVSDEFEKRWKRYLHGLPVELIFIKQHEALHEAVQGAGMIITKKRPVDKKLLDLAGPSLRKVIKLSRWALDVDVQACERKGIRLTCLPQYGAISVAEQTMVLLLACGRDLIAGHLGVVNGLYRDYDLTPELTTERSFAPKWIPIKSYEVYDKTLGIIGLGEIGREVALRARAFGMKVLYYKRTPLPENIEQELGVIYCDLPRILETSDFISLHIPHTERTEKMLGKAQFKAMKSTAYLVNTARGGVIDEEALVWALESKEIAGAGLDVFAMEPVPHDHPLLSLENVVLSPHTGGGSRLGRIVLTKDVRAQISQVLNDTPSSKGASKGA